ncbi:hypothetical protein mhp519 [Mesomycoplasma hyopneumoniae 232]|uniref:Uncharacterized protein n=1 Tax=Mesomycoplasma hyopneumoniae (strain 232) TaxID=295358 RepID=Q600D6_MESH2|nr:hypothetical protein mhp519 [Mesomycoplasma hyopneumoniae 232]
MPKDKNIMIIKNISLKYSINKRFFRKKQQKFLTQKLNYLYSILKSGWIFLRY